MPPPTQRIRDGVVLRVMGKWLNAGVMADGAVTPPETGSPQGGVVSPLLANVYLHYVLDPWFAWEVPPRLKGRAYVIRDADDFVIGLTEDEAARRVIAVLPKRFGKYGLTIHPDKTRRVPFCTPQGERKPPDGNGPGTFDHAVLWVWRKWLLRRRRAWRARAGWFRRLLERSPVPSLRAVHSVYCRVASG